LARIALGVQSQERSSSIIAPRMRGVQKVMNLMPWLVSKLSMQLISPSVPALSSSCAVTA